MRMKRTTPHAICILLCTACSLFTPDQTMAEPHMVAPQLLVLQGPWLQQNKARIKSGDPELEPAYAALIERADTALSAGPFSVTHKTIMPPSGDRHDYMSFGPYWWPDPSKPDGLPYIRRDGEVNPDSKGAGSDSPRMGQMMATVETLALAYYFSDDPRYAERAALLLRTWYLDPETRMNPHLKYGQGIPGRVEGRGIGIIDTARLPRVLDSVRLIADSNAWTDDDQRSIEAWFTDYLDWLQTHPYGIQESRERNNHGTYYDVQVAAAALFVGKQEIAEAVVQSIGVVRIARQIEPDGSQPHELGRTLSFDYSVMNLAGFFTLARLAEHVEVDLWHYATPDGRGLKPAIDFLTPYADSNVKWTHKQIKEVRPITLLPLLQQAAAVYGDAKYQAAINCLPATEAEAHVVRLLHP